MRGIDEVLDLLRENIVPVNKDGYYATLMVDSVNEDDFGNVFVNISGEIFTEDILDYDNYIFQRDEVNREKVKIFFYGYSDVRVSFEDFLLLTRCLCEKSKYKVCDITENGFCNGMYSKICEFTDALEGIYDNNQYRCFMEKWNQAMSEQLFSIKFCSNSKLKANVYFGASPFQLKSTYLKFINITNKKLPQLQKISYTQKQLLINDEYIPLRINTYNVGQGNFSIIECENEKSVAVDLGITRLEKHLPTYSRVIERLGELDSDIIIISHLDIDHILGVQYIPDEMFKKTWIISVHGKRSQSANRLLAYLLSHNKHNTYLIDDCSNWIFGFGAFNIYQGIGVKIGNCSNINTGSLIVSIDYKQKRALLPGDCVYAGIPNLLHGKYDFLLAPHHGCNLEGRLFIDKFNPVSANSMAVVSYGQNSFGHPSNDHMCALCKKGFLVKRTFGFYNVLFVF